MEQTNEKKSEKTKVTTTRKTSTRTASKSSTKKDVTKKTTAVKKEVAKKSTSTKKVSSSTKTPKKSITTKPIVTPKEISNTIEYYDLPYRYNQTVVKILAQTPHSLFVYWDISDDDRRNLETKYGESFFYDTKPILIVHNETQKYSFEVEIDDFTNSWYLKTPTSNCKFNIELGRKKIASNDKIWFNTPDSRLHITASNTIESPNDHILFDSIKDAIMFKNIKTNQLEERKVPNYNTLKDLYNSFDFSEDFIHNPSSNFKI